MTRNSYAYVNGDPVNLSDPTGHYQYGGCNDEGCHYAFKGVPQPNPRQGRHSIYQGTPFETLLAGSGQCLSGCGPRAFAFADRSDLQWAALGIDPGGNNFVHAFTWDASSETWICSCDGDVVAYSGSGFNLLHAGNGFAQSRIAPGVLFNATLKNGRLPSSTVEAIRTELHIAAMEAQGGEIVASSTIGLAFAGYSATTLTGSIDGGPSFSFTAAGADQIVVGGVSSGGNLVYRNGGRNARTFAPRSWADIEGPNRGLSTFRTAEQAGGKGFV